MNYFNNLNLLSQLGVLIIVCALFLIFLIIIFSKLRKKPNVNTVQNENNTFSSKLTALIDKIDGPNGTEIRYTKIANRLGDKVTFKGKGSTKINLSIGFLNVDNLNFLCFETIKSIAPLSKGSFMMFHSKEDDIICLELEEKPLKLTNSKSNNSLIESRVHLSLAEIRFLINEEIKHISYVDSNGKNLIVFGDDNNSYESKKSSFKIFRAAFYGFLKYVKKETGKITYKDIDSANIKTEKKRSRHISQEVKDKVWNRDGGKCVDCSSNINLEFDHIIPWSKGGANTYRNIQLLCEKCNRAKSDTIGDSYDDDLQDPFLNVLDVDILNDKYETETESNDQSNVLNNFFISGFDDDDYKN